MDALERDEQIAEVEEAIRSLYRAPDYSTVTRPPVYWWQLLPGHAP